MKKGFTLLEVIIALLIVGILATGLLPALASLTKASLNSELIYAAPNIAQTTLSVGNGPKNVYTEKFGVTATKTSLETKDDEKIIRTVTVDVPNSTYGFSLSSFVSKVGHPGSSTPTVPDNSPPNETAKYTLYSESITNTINTTPTTVSTGPGNAGGSASFYAYPNDQYGQACPNATPPSSVQFLESATSSTLKISGTGAFWYLLYLRVPSNSTITIYAEPESSNYLGPVAIIYYWYAKSASNVGTEPVAAVRTPNCSLPNVWYANGSPEKYYNGTTGTITLSASGNDTFYDWGFLFRVSSGIIYVTLNDSGPSSPGSGPSTFTKYVETSTTIRLNPDKLAGWNTLSFDLSKNGSVSVEVWTRSSPVFSFAFENTSNVTESYEISLNVLNLPPEGLNVKFEINSIDHTKPAEVSRITVNYLFSEEDSTEGSP